MKVQFKYAFLTGLHARGGVFAVIFVMNLVFIVLGSLGLLPVAAKIVAVSLGGSAIAVMMVVNVISDIAIIRRMFSAPGAYLYALTPTPRRKTLFASLISMLVMDAVSMAVLIFGEVWLSLIMVDEYYQIWDMIWSVVRASPSDILFSLWFIALFIAGYLLIMMVIIFCITARRSVLYNKPVGGVLTAVLALLTVYAISLSTFIIAPFGEVSRWGMYFTISVGREGLIAYVILTFIQAAALFALTSKLMERKLNI